MSFNSLRKLLPPPQTINNKYNLTRSLNYIVPKPPHLAEEEDVGDDGCVVVVALLLLL